MPTHPSKSSPILALVVGIAASIGILVLVQNGNQTVDWKARAEEHIANGEWPEAYETLTHAIAAEPENDRLYFDRATAADRMRMNDAAVADIDRAIKIAPRTIQYQTRKAFLLVAQQRPREAIALIDAMLVENPNQTALVVTAASTRVQEVMRMERDALALLQRIHPEILTLKKRLYEHLRSPVIDSVGRHLLLDPLSPGASRDLVEQALDQSWTFLREADLLLRSERNYVNILGATLDRIRIDIRLGRLLRAKEELQTVLRGKIQLVHVRLCYEWLADVFEELGDPRSRAECYDHLCDIETTTLGAPSVSRLADRLEAMWFAADADESLRDEWVAEADEHLEKHRNVDLRTVGYRGLAALRWTTNDRDALTKIAAECLGEVYQALQVQRRVDRSIQDPERASRFMVGLLDTYQATGDLSRALQVVNSLISFAPGDTALLRQSAAIKRALGRPGDAANDLLQAMRTSRRDPALFELWLKTAEEDRDSIGRSPREIARANALQFVRTLQFFDNPADAILRDLGRHERSIANNPLLAWLMSEEYGRVGESDLSRAFLNKAVRAEPNIPGFHLRMGQRLLDSGLFEAAANQFNYILSRHPDDFQAAWYAYEALRLVGETEKARQLRFRSMQVDPKNCGLKFGASAALEAGDFQRATQMLAPYPIDSDAVIARLVGETRVMAGNYGAAIDALLQARRLDPTSPEVSRLLILAYATLGDRSGFETEVRLFSSLPRLLPVERIDRMVFDLSESGLHSEAAVVAEAVAQRFSGRERVNLAALGALELFRAGFTQNLRSIKNADGSLGYLPESVVRAAFGITLRDEGVDVAADYLRRISDDTPRPWANLAASASLALTPHRTDARRHFDHFLAAQKGIPVPDADVATFFILARRLGVAVSPNLLVNGSEAEIAWLRQLSGTEREVVEELYLRMYMFMFAGPELDDLAEEVARQLGGMGWDAITATRVIATVKARQAGVAEGAELLFSRYRHNARDYPTLRLLGSMLLESDRKGDVLAVLGNASLSLFPDAPEPLLYLAVGNARLRNGTVAVGVLDQMFDRFPQSELTLQGYLELAKAQIAGTRKVVSNRLATIGAESPEAREFLVRQLSSPHVEAKEVRELLGPIVGADPTFYSGAALLARAFARLDQTSALQRLADEVSEVVIGDDASETNADALTDLSRTLLNAGFDDEAIRVADAAVVVAPADVRLRVLRTDLYRALDRETAAMDDLAILCLLSPRSSDVQFNYGELLLDRRTDLYGILNDLLPHLAILASDDPRLHALRARLLFLHEKLDEAEKEMVLAANGAPERPSYQYLAGLYAFLNHDDETALARFRALPKDHPMAPRLKWIEESVKVDTP